MVTLESAFIVMSASISAIVRWKSDVVEPLAKIHNSWYGERGRSPPSMLLHDIFPLRLTTFHDVLA